jgi:phosphatidate cytidylyltransferase
MPASRKILIRVVGAPLLVAALCALLYWGHGFAVRGRPNLPLHGLVALVGLVCAWEIRGMCGARGIAIASTPLLLALGFLFGRWASSASGGMDPLKIFVTIASILFLVTACLMVARFGAFTPEAAGLTLFGFLYVSLLGFLLFPPISGAVHSYFLLFLLAAGKGSDMAAFVAGKSIGKHKMAPVVSPNKTWEGGVAGGIVGTGAGLAVILLTPLREAYSGIPVAALLLLSLMVTIAGQVGDLVKSAFKRWAGVKDSGRILPEFGGMIDMVDSFVLEGPVACLGTLLLFGSLTAAAPSSSPVKYNCQRPSPPCRVTFQTLGSCSSTAIRDRSISVFSATGAISISATWTRATSTPSATLTPFNAGKTFSCRSGSRRFRDGSSRRSSATTCTSGRRTPRRAILHKS